MTATQLVLLAPQHTVTAYAVPRLPGADRTCPPRTWWSWRCTCGRDPGAEGRFWTTRQDDAADMGHCHAHGQEPWAHPQPGPAVTTRGLR